MRRPINTDFYFKETTSLNLFFPVPNIFIKPETNFFNVDTVTNFNLLRPKVTITFHEYQFAQSSKPLFIDQRNLSDCFLNKDDDLVDQHGNRLPEFSVFDRPACNFEAIIDGTIQQDPMVNFFILNVPTSISAKFSADAIKNFHQHNCLISF